MQSTYDTVRSAVLETGADSRVEVNQRALIDKILARYASAGAVYRELLQNSNDAEATTAEVRFTSMSTPNGPRIAEVAYRNDGHPFRPQDWSRLRKIAEGNPDVAKVGAFGVGAYTMFSICEEPLIISGAEALAFAWRGDSLWVRAGPSPHKPDKWTTFVLPSRDPYPLPDLVEFGKFLCSSLTFTQCLHTINVFVDNEKRLTISKKQIQKPTIITPPKASSWWNNDGTITHSPKKLFALGRSDGSIMETVIEMKAEIGEDVASVRARYVSATADAKIPSDMARKMYRVTKKKTPPQVNIEVFIDASSENNLKSRSPAAAIIGAFSPTMGAGRVFIGFKTSQTTGLAAHLAAPLIPTVEREAIDFQDPTLNHYNSELLSVAGIVMRLALEHSMGIVGAQWEKTKDQRVAEEKKLYAESRLAEQKEGDGENARSSGPSGQPKASEESKQGGGLFGFAKFMSSGVRKIAEVISSVELLGGSDEDLLNPSDRRPLSVEERDAIMLMRSFCPRQSTPDPTVGTVIANGFANCMPNLTPPVLTQTGVVRSTDGRLPQNGIESFVEKNVVRKAVMRNAEDYLYHVAQCPLLTLRDLRNSLETQPLSEDEAVRLLKWWTKYYARGGIRNESDGLAIKQSVVIAFTSSTNEEKPASDSAVLPLQQITSYVQGCLSDEKLPMPLSVFPISMRRKLPHEILRDPSLVSWFSPISMTEWVQFICKHPCLTNMKKRDEAVRLTVLATLSGEYGRSSSRDKAEFGKLCHSSLSNVRCIPYEGGENFPSSTELPTDLYLPSAELKVFNGLGSFKKVSRSVNQAGISDDFLVLLGVRKAIAIDFLFTQLDNLKWSEDPKPLIEYLSSASLNNQDIEKLRRTKYLPAVDDKKNTYSPLQLYLPNPELKLFPFVNILQWPSDEVLTTTSLNGRFLMKLGCRSDPPLQAALGFMTKTTVDEKTRIACLDFVSSRLGPNGSYNRDYAVASSGSSVSSYPFHDVCFLPAIRMDPLGNGKRTKELQSPRNCYSKLECSCMGFPVLDTILQKNAVLYGERFLCNSQPGPEVLVTQLLSIVSFAKQMSSRKDENDYGSHGARILNSFSNIFAYMSTRTTEITANLRNSLKKEAFIPVSTQESIQWCRPAEVYFQNPDDTASELTSVLYHVIDANPFLYAVGVRSEASNADLFRLMISSPQLVFEKLGSESKYRSLLRRIAADPPYRKVSKEMKNSAFLIAYQFNENAGNDLSEAEGQQPASARFSLAKAADICIVDNSHFARMFNALSAPQESDLELFYETFGSTFISKKVQVDYGIAGQPLRPTPFTVDFEKRLRERTPLLVSPIVTSRPLVSGAASVLSEENLQVFEVSSVKALYTLGSTAKNQHISCCAKPLGRANFAKRKHGLFVTKDFDWFDVGSAIGGLILRRCQLEDSFFVGSLLSTPLQQLRQRGFPVDRILPTLQPAPVLSKAISAGSGEDRQPGGGLPVVTNGRSPQSTLVNTESKGVKNNPNSEGQGPDKGGFKDILQQMFPDCDEAHILALLGSTPSLDKLREVADTLANGQYPRKQKTEGSMAPPRNPSQAEEKSKPADAKRLSSRKGSGGLLSRAFRSMRGSAVSETPSAGSGPSIRVRHASSSGRTGKSPAGPEDDLNNSNGLNDLLKKSVRSSRSIDPSGVSAPDTLLTSEPEGLERDGGGCEIINGHNLKPFLGVYGNGKARNGVRVFSSLREPSSETFLTGNSECIEAFSVVLMRLCSVYKVDLDSTAIFHEQGSRTIAFNLGGSLYFNIRFFRSLHHDKTSQLKSCYAYWFTVMAHELAHNLVSPHNKAHGFYTESYISHYLPIFINLCSQYSL